MPSLYNPGHNSVLDHPIDSPEISQHFAEAEHTVYLHDGRFLIALPNAESQDVTKIRSSLPLSSAARSDVHVCFVGEHFGLQMPADAALELGFSKETARPITVPVIRSEPPPRQTILSSIAMAAQAILNIRPSGRPAPTVFGSLRNSWPLSRP